MRGCFPRDTRHPWIQKQENAVGGHDCLWEKDLQEDLMAGGAQGFEKDGVPFEAGGEGIVKVALARDSQERWPGEAQTQG